MTFRLTLALSAGACLALSAPAMAQDAPHFTLPEMCRAEMPDADPAMPGAAMHGDHGAAMHGDHGAASGEAMHSGHGAMASGDAPMDHADVHMDHGAAHAESDPAAMPEHVRINLEKMAVTMDAMHMGMLQEDADIAFACGMIAHHQAAIDMAEVLLDHGQDPDMRSLATEIIEAQTAEIDRMTRWLETAAK
ncbi:CopM family metallochaperone [Ponticoccus alexandrii]|uniref:DUF305 domain-containing protein n=1 Tax=Ponticoccus alexandrii TaxID=1943633 RepID=A0ABX7FB15_9RHOB|nr:DUF305 domain-containing protein [Ponticoccus alexandrii]ETA49291.1 hypothetical protein P279_25400 [Rhodobacteraceae bacterium PD-2]QRF67746.1 DUF305 domain-containing protein [Ponticoccus alexandrii]